MATYKDLLSHKDFLKVAMRARALSNHGCNLYAIAYRDQTIYFKTRSATDDNLIYTQRIYLSQATFDNVLNARTFKDVERLLKNGDIKVDCDCKAFNYYFKYVAWKHGYGIEKEYRPALIRNPYEIQSVCKHLHLVLQIFPYLIKPLASKFRHWAESKVIQPQNTQSDYFGKYKVHTTLGDNNQSLQGETISMDQEPISDTSTSLEDSAPQLSTQDI